MALNLDPSVSPSRVVGSREYTTRLELLGKHSPDRAASQHICCCFIDQLPVSSIPPGMKATAGP
ncbi:rCG22148 [Rattus norvegicus]|uniref:RCG22148 n=1 Tax=Rattus norvegicus TaxID=10116 RepID=A6K401_RAT|nr:rCG22148 [Rattus norvegicus]